MPDWREIAAQRLTPLALEAERQEEIVIELADHLEDLYSDLIRQGKSEVEAVQSAWSIVADWDELRHEVQLAANEEGIMNCRLGPAGERRFRTLWLPGVCTGALASVLLRLLQIPSAPAPSVFWPWHSTELVIYWRWLVCLPVVGGIGAYWSRHAGGKLMQRVLAVSFPVLGMISLPVLMSPFALVFHGIVHHESLLVPFALLLLGWGVLPEAALLLGALPFLRGDAGESRPVAASH